MRQKLTCLLLTATSLVLFITHQAVLAKSENPSKTSSTTSNTCNTLFQKNQYAQAIEACQNLADQHNAEGQYYLGMLYLQGLGTQPHQELAFRHLLHAAFNQHAQAQYQVAKLYSLGIGVERNERQAAKWYLASAKNGVKEALLASSLINRLGIGLPKNNALAFSYYQDAMQKKIPDLQKLEQASFNFQRVVVPEGGQQEFERAMILQLGLTQSLSTDQNEVTRLLSQSAELGHPDALISLAECYQQGKGVTQNDLEAFTYYKKAALFGHSEGMFQVSYRYLLGQGVPQDSKQAIQWLNKIKDLTEQNKRILAFPRFDLNKITQNQQIIHHHSPIIPKLPTSHEEKYNKAIALSEENDDANFKEALKWFSQSAQLGNKNAQYKLGMFYLTGKGLPQNYVYSYSWLNLSSAQGVTEANQAKIYLESKMTPEQLHEAQRLSEEVYSSIKELL